MKKKTKMIYYFFLIINVRKKKENKKNKPSNKVKKKERTLRRVKENSVGFFLRFVLHFGRKKKIKENWNKINIKKNIRVLS